MIDPSRMFHTGCLVHDVEAQMKVYSAATGVRWAKPVHISGSEFWMPGRGMVRYDHLLTYSVDGPQYLEIQRGAPGSFYDPDARSGFHIGFWSDNVAAETAELTLAGWTVECASLSPEQGYGLYTYLAPPGGGMMVELVGSHFRPALERWLGGGELSL